MKIPLHITSNPLEKIWAVIHPFLFMTLGPSPPSRPPNHRISHLPSVPSCINNPTALLNWTIRAQSPMRRVKLKVLSRKWHSLNIRPPNSLSPFYFVSTCGNMWQEHDPYINGIDMPASSNAYRSQSQKNFPSKYFESRVSFSISFPFSFSPPRHFISHTTFPQSPHCHNSTNTPQYNLPYQYPWPNWI